MSALVTMGLIWLPLFSLSLVLENPIWVLPFTLALVMGSPPLAVELGLLFFGVSSSLCHSIKASVPCLVLVLLTKSEAIFLVLL